MRIYSLGKVGAMFLVFLVALLYSHSVSLNAQTLQLVRTIPKSILVDASQKPLLLDWTVNDKDAGDYGFLWSGKALYFGRGAWVYDLEEDDLRREFPEELHRVVLSRDGNLAFGYTKRDELWRMEGRNQRSGQLGTINGPVHDWFCIHPSNTMIAEWDVKYRSAIYMDAIDFRAVRTGELIDRYRPGFAIPWMEEFTADGRYLTLSAGTTLQLLELQTMKLTPVDDFGELQDSRVVINSNASKVAGRYSKMGYLGSCFVWDRLHKRRDWTEPEKENYGNPSSFSPNDKFLLCEGVIVNSVTGDLAFRNLEGKQGKFSPDGRSLVTVDDEAFHIYTLPKDSEPIFGVFQKPEPWSRLVSKKRAKTPIKRP